MIHLNESNESQIQSICENSAGIFAVTRENFRVTPRKIPAEFLRCHAKIFKILKVKRKNKNQNKNLNSSKSTSKIIPIFDVDFDELRFLF